MLYGSSINGQLACLVCMKQQKALRLRNGGKFSWFDCHRCFLPMNHAFKRNRRAFRKGRIVIGGPPCRISGEELYAEVTDYQIVTTNSDFVIPRFKENEHSWTKKSIFWGFSYWQHHFLRRNLHVMHI